MQVFSSDSWIHKDCVIKEPFGNNGEFIIKHYDKNGKLIHVQYPLPNLDPTKGVTLDKYI